ncbi:MAG: L-2-hydroxyglutarate oxidase [Bacteroidales bacterium]|jgi:L-2-hydroxyglutarate oxidase|nr:L-2-hydroxyglutarate oxidase [Bacteroidales bacterium]
MQYHFVIIGGGIVGMATAWKLALKNPGLRIAVLEKESVLASHQTGHNSGVIHSGIYYTPGSLKARNCIEGYRQLISFCQEENIPFKICGKLIVATTQKQIPLLEELYRKGIANGLNQIKRLSSSEIKDYEPNAAGLAALWVPYTGIVDYAAVAEKIAQKFRELGGEIFPGSKVIALKDKGDFTEVITPEKTYLTKFYINTAGLYSDRIALLTGKQLSVRIIPFRGEYYTLRENRTWMVKNLIYPVPDPEFPFLGVHFTRTIKGTVEAGPNAVFAFRREGYRKWDISLPELAWSLSWKGFRQVMAKYFRMGLAEYYRSFFKKAFVKELQKLLPEITEDDLLPGGSGVRAQACTDTGKLADDFIILENKNGLDILNAPSPAATASLAIGEHIARLSSERILPYLA